MGPSDPSQWWLGAAFVVGSFLVGSFNPAAVLATLKGADLRASGSGNPGATNAGRVLGARWGVLVAVLDVAKGFLPVWLADTVGLDRFWVLLCGMAAVLGHMFSPFLRGRGGKGVATMLGALLGVEPGYALIAVVVVVVALPVFRRMGLAAAFASAVLVCVGLADLGGLVGLADRLDGLWLVLLAALVGWRHRKNVVVGWRARRAAGTT
ncbi:MAG: glycerol-3-phosphate acyltransferase [Nostocoides sp.]